MKIQPSFLLIAIAVAFQAQPSYGAEPAQMRPLLIHGDWEVVGRYVVDDKGIKSQDRERDSKEWLRISRGAIQVYRNGKEKPNESIEMKVVSLADQRDGVIEMTEKNLGLGKMMLLYRFEGRRLLLCMSENFESKPTSFAAKGSRIIELIPYQHNRLVLTCLRPPPKPEKVFNNVVPPMPPNPPPVADPK